MSRFEQIAVYLMASKPNGTLYLGVTSDLLQRGIDHREGRYEGFAKKYGCKTLVWWEQHFDIEEAIRREKQLKGWKRKWKLALIEKTNPTWRDLYEDFLLPPQHRRSSEHETQRSGPGFRIALRASGMTLG